MAVTIQKAFGASVRRIRQGRGYSQEKFALLINMDRTYYASVEAGRRNVSLVNISKIAGGLGISLSDLFGDVESFKED